MKTLLTKITQAFQRDRNLPLTERLRKGSHYLSAIASAPFFLRNCTRVGSLPRIAGRIVVSNLGTIEIGDNLKVFSHFNPVQFLSGPEGKLAIKDQVVINFGTIISAEKQVTIGNKVSIGPYCIIADADLPHSTDHASGPEPIEIGDGVWLASRVTVRPGTVIGAGSTITAGSIVSGIIPPGVVAGGIPARVMRSINSINSATTPDITDQAAERASATSQPEAKAAATIKRPAFRGLLLADFTIDQLAEQLAGLTEGPALSASVAPFDQVMQNLMQKPAEDADFAVVWTRPEAVSPSFQRLVDNENAPLAQILDEVDAFCAVLLQGCQHYRFAFVPTWTWPFYQRGLGLTDARPGGTAHALSAMNNRLMDRLSQAPNAYVLGAQRWIEAAGAKAYSPKLWYMGKAAFHPQVLTEAARDIQAAIAGLTGAARKLVVVDLDDTLWGGIVGDAGWQNLRLGGHDATGEAFVDFQRKLKALTRRGIVLAIVSKNEESVALEAIRQHPAMVLRETDFVAWKINWQDKARNIAELTSELNLGLQSVVFIDDNPVERARVQEALPEVLVPAWPEDKLLYASALTSLRCFDAPAISREDAERTKMYATERQREALKTQVGSIDEWLKGLNIQIQVEPLNASNLARTTQLLNKTNQMNLSTRRLTESQLSDWAKEAGNTLLTVSVCDRFGDAGLTGILGLCLADSRCSIVDYILSCRVMGRKVEEAMLHLAARHAQKNQVKSVVARHLPTLKNKPCLDFFARSGFSRQDDGVFTWDASNAYALPECITLKEIP